MLLEEYDSIFSLHPPPQVLVLLDLMDGWGRRTSSLSSDEIPELPDRKDVVGEDLVRQLRSDLFPVVSA